MALEDKKEVEEPIKKEKISARKLQKQQDALLNHQLNDIVKKLGYGGDDPHNPQNHNIAKKLRSMGIDAMISKQNQVPLSMQEKLDSFQQQLKSGRISKKKYDQLVLQAHMFG